MGGMHEKLKEVAVRSLRTCYVENKVVASPTHFSDFWARDTFWALPGVLAIGDKKIAKNCIEYFLSFQRGDGKIPRKISRDINVLKYLFGKSIQRKKPRPVYTALVRPFYSMDDNALLIRAAWKYLEVTQDEESLREWYPKLKLAFEWYESRMHDGLLREGLLANWMDTVWKRGAVLYTNALYCEALRCMVRITDVLGNQEDAQIFERRWKEMKNNIEKHFWNGKFLEEKVPFKIPFKVPKKYFDVAGNMLACLFDMVDAEKQKSIVKEFHGRSNRDILCQTQYPKYSRWRINPVAHLFGIADYHNGVCWSWVLAIVAAAEQKTGYDDMSKKRMEAFEEAARRDGEMGETYFLDSRPYKKRLWKSASPFAWGSGMWIELLDK